MMDEERNELQVIVAESGLEPSKAQVMLDRFSDYFRVAAEWEQKAKVLVVTDESQTTEMKMAREGRLFLREKRIAIENTRKQLKEQALREGKAIDGIANALKAVIVPIEEYLDQQEHYIEHKRAAEEEARRLEAEKLLREKEEAERKAAEEEDQRIRAENLRLQKEAAEREAAAQKEREAATRKLAAERKKAEEAARKEREAAEAKLAAERKAAEEKAAAERAEHEREMAEQRKQAAAEAERARKEAERKAKLEREELEQKLAEERRTASMVTCPYCGGQFNVAEKS